MAQATLSLGGERITGIYRIEYLKQNLNLFVFFSFFKVILFVLKMVSRFKRKMNFYDFLQCF